MTLVDDKYAYFKTVTSSGGTLNDLEKAWYSLAASGTVVFNNLQVDGTFTSQGIDDNATGVQLTLTDSGVVIDDDIFTTSDTGAFNIYGGSSTSSANIGVYGGTHVSKAFDTEFRAGATVWGNYDHSAQVYNSNVHLFPMVTESYDLGSASFEWDNLFVQNAVTVSDQRRKNDLGTISKATEFLRLLDPKIFSYKDTVVPAHTDEHGVYHEEKVVPHGRPHAGFMAQEVKEAMDKAGIEDLALYAYDEESDTHLLRLNELIGYLVKGWQEVDERLKALENA